MAFKRLTKQDIQGKPGILNPVGHILIAFKNDAATADAATALRELGFTDADILQYTNAEATPRLRERVTALGKGHGFEITLMRRYLSIAERGAGWLVVYAPTDLTAQLATGVSKRLGAMCAVRYHEEGNEDLVY